MISYTNLSSSAYDNLRYALILQIEEGGVPKFVPYIDPDGLTTIGAGFNIEDNATLRDYVFDQLGIGDAETSVRQALTHAIQTASSTANVRSSLDAIMAARGGSRSTFAFQSEAEIINVFNRIAPTFETAVDNKIAVPTSKERVALFSLAYNNPALIGPGLTAAINSGDRAEAFYEIRFDSNGDGSNGIAKRRYIESEIFGLYNNPTAVTKADAFLAIRMFTKHEKRILAYEAQYGSYRSAANSDLQLIEQKTGQAFGDVLQMQSELAEARQVLIGIFGRGKQYDAVWIAPSESAGKPEVAAHTVDRRSAGDSRDLILGSVTNDGFDADGYDFLYGGGGDDTIIGGGGNDFIDGGSGTNYLSGGKGFDRIRSRGQNDTVEGGEDVQHLGSGGGGAALALGATDPGEQSVKYVALGATTTLQGATKDDRIFYSDIMLTGGVAPWWDESNIAVNAPLTNLAYAFPTIGADLIAAGALFADAPWMKFAMYRQEANGDLTVRFGYGLGGYATIKNYSVDLAKGGGTAGLTIFKQGGHGRTAAVDQGIASYVNLALKAGWGHGLDGMDPLVLDLDGDGYDVTAREYSQVYFDFDGSGFAKQTGWVLGDDALLTRDINGNGLIDDGTELFGNRAQSGFAMLSALDSNADGKIDSADTEFGSLRVWRDLNQDGVSQDGELQTLSEAGIASISLATADQPAGTEVRGNPLARAGHFTRTDGTTGDVGDITFNVSDLNTRWTGAGDASAAALALPQLGGLGTMRDLRHAMTDDTQLLTMVNNLVGSAGTAIPTLMGDVEQILYRWAGVDGVAATPLGNNGFDARKLAFLEKYSGVQLLPRNTDGSINTGSLASVEDVWNYDFPQLALKLLAQGPLSSQFAGLDYLEDYDQLRAAAPDTISAIIDRVLDGMPATQADAQAYWSQWAPLLGAMAGAALRSSGASVGPDFFFAQLVAGADGRTLPLGLTELAAGLGVEGIHIGSEETLTRVAGENGTQVWYADQANAVMTGGGGQDAYIFGHSIGNAVITDIEARENGDRIRFAFLNADDVTMKRDGNDLLITVTATNETVRVTGQFAPVTLLGSDNVISSNKGVEDIQFADGTIMEAPDIAIAVGKGTAGNDHLVGTMHTDVLQGMAGDDLMEGGDDADLYYVKAGDGHDTIRDQASTPYLRGMDMLIFGDGIAPSDVHFARGANADDLMITIGDDGAQSVLIQGQFGYSSLGFDAPLSLNSRIEAFSFSDYAQTWSSQEIMDLLVQQSTTDGNDTTYGFGGADTFQASAGDDMLIGMDGADTYNWGIGSGHDTIDEQSRYIDVEVGLGGISLTTRADTIVFGEGITVDDVIFKSALADSDLRISLANSDDTLVVKGQFGGFQTGVLGAQWFNRVEWFQFADGTKLSWQDVLGRVTTGTDGNDELRGDLFADTLRGGKGDDYLSGRGVGDTYIFNVGDGHDTIDDANTDILGDGFLTADTTPDILKLGPGILPSDLSFAHNGNDIDLIIGTNGDRVTLKGQDSYAQTGVFGAISFTRVEEIHFDNGTVWTWQDLNRNILNSLTTSGNDSIQGFSFEDRFEASAGDDVLMGGDSADTYVFGIGSGHDTVREGVSNVFYGDDDTIEFAGSILPQDVTLTRNGVDLTLSLASGDSIKIEGEFAYQAWFTWTDVENFKFSNGTVWTIDDIKHMLLTPTSGNDTIVGFGGEDVIDGGAGDDILMGGDGSDTYLFGVGSGHDIIRESLGNTNLGEDDVLKFGASVLPGDVQLSRSGDDLTLTLPSGDSVKIEGEFAYQAWFTWTDVDRFQFADGTEWTKADITARLVSGAGTPGNDHIVGFSGDDVFDGGAGDDVMEGVDGNDTYKFGRGYGHDQIIEDHGNYNLGEFDVVELGAGIAPADVRVDRVGEDMVLTLDTGETLTVTKQFNEGTYEFTTVFDIEEIRFQDGTVWDKTAIANRYFHPTSGDDVVEGTRQDQSFISGAGNDTIRAGAGDDILEGGTGNDLLQGQSGSDVYRFNLGDGQDVITDSVFYDGNGVDTLEFGPGITPAMVSVVQADSGQDLILSIAGTTDRVTLDQSMNDPNNRIEQVRFADSTVWTHAQLVAMSLISTPGDDTLYGTYDNEVIGGGAGNDTLQGRSGDDVLTGGTGNDLLQGQYGDDRYVYQRGDGDDVIREGVFYDGGGTDTLQLGPGIAPSDVTVTQTASGYDYLLTIAGGGSIRLDYAIIDGTQRIEFVNFDDGTVWTADDLLAKSMIGSAANDTLHGDNGPNFIDGRAGNDTIDGLYGDDIIVGGPGDDYLSGSGGNDTYRFARGDGQDIIHELISYNSGGGGTDTVEFAAGILPGDVTVSATDNGQDLVLKIAGTTDQITLDQTLWSDDYKIEFVKFADGTVWSSADMVLKASTGTPGNDTLFGDGAANVIDGAAGDDTIDGKGGDDVVIGGLGNDTLSGGDGNDTFRFARGDGQDRLLEGGNGTDTIELASGISPSDITVTQSADGFDLVVSINGSTDKITIVGDLSASTGRIEQLRFADGTLWSHTDLVQKSLENDADAVIYGGFDDDLLAGTSRAETIDGRSGNDIISGGGGNDILLGSGGDDTFRFARGDGQDIIRERGSSYFGGNDKIEFAAGIAPSDVTVVQANGGQDLVLKINGTADQLTIAATMVNSDYRVEQVTFADSTVWSHAQLVQMSMASNAGSDTFYGSYDSETLAGGAGNDILDGREGDDVIIGGTGNDTLYGSGGNDTFRFARGDGQDFIHERGVGFYGGTDTVEFAAGIAPSDVTVVQADSGHDIILKINGATDQITLDETLVNSDDLIEFVKFADGTVWTASDLVQKSSGGTPGNDTLYGDTGNNLIDGGAGDDTIEGSGGDDILIGGTGNDLLYGSGGNDTFRFNRGDGWDTIKERGNYFYGGNDTVEFGPGIAASDISVSQANGYSDLILKINGTSDRITLWGDMNNSDYRIEQVKFADTTVLTHAQLVQMSMANNGDNDIFYGTYDSETLNGGAGDDTINGMGGTDIIIGGTGNDYLTDGGNATYKFARGDGQDTVKAGAGFDTIEFAAGIAASDLSVTQANGGADLIIKINGTSDQITVRSTMVDGYSRLDQVKFADNSTLTHAQLVQMSLANNGGNDVLYGSYDAETINGGAGDDIINGQGGNDIIVGGAGNDYVTGSGNLTFRFARGDGQDTVKASAGFDTIEFAAGIAASDLTVVQANGTDLVIKINGTSDQLTVKSTLVDGYSRLEQVRFADNSTLTHAQLVQMSYANNGGNDTFYGSYDAETINGGAGDDVITGQGGNDILVGGTGNDILSGSGGSMTYRLARGDGQDVVKANGGTDTIEFAAGIAASDLSVVQANGGNDLVIKINGTTDQITIPNTMTNGSWRLEQVRFADNSTLTHAQLVQMSYANNAGANTFYGSYDAETITGGAGADMIDGRSGDDIIIGGAGDDMLGGSSGNDTYRFARGDGRDIIKDSTANGSGGNDTIEFAAGISQSDLIVEQASNGADLIIKISGTADQITISADISDVNSRIEQVKFADSSTLTYAQLLALTSTAGNDTLAGDTLANTLDGGAGNDLIDAKAGDDILIGGTGNDWLGGSSGNDTYRFGRGDGEDVIRDATANGSGGTDTLELGAGIALADLVVVEANGGNDLILKINGSTDQVTLSSTMNDGSNRIEQVKLADTTIVTHAQLVQMALASNSGDDLFWGTYDAETIDGGAGDDVIDARAGDDILIGGAGNDVLGGSSGNDTYRFGRGDGQDIVRDSNASGAGGTDTLELGAGIAQSDITVVQANGGNDLVIKINGTTDQVTLASTVNDGNNRIEQVRFADNSTLTHAQLMALAFANNGGNDSFYGSWEANTIDGGAGNDTLVGWDGDDILIGGTGNDVLAGGFGNDTYRFSRGDGQDVISDASAGGYRGNETLEFGAGIAASDLTVVQGNNGNDLIIRINGTSDQVTLANDMTSFDYRIEQVRFADNSTLSHAQLVQMSLANNSGNDTFYGSYDSETINGGAGDDYLIGNDGNDVMVGGAGNDILSGGFGNDTYVFARGDGQDIVYDAKAGGYRGNETVQFAAGIAPSDVTVSNSSNGEDLILKINGTSDQVTLAYTLNYFDDRIEQVTFADTTVWTHADLVQKAYLNNAGNNSFYGSYDSETIDGGTGNDSISAKDGNDTVIGGDGDDVLDGGNGTDTASYATAGAGVTVNLSLTAMQNTLGAGYDTLTNFENLTGSGFNDTLIGSSGVNLIIGGSGNDLISGGAGSDTAKVAGLRASYTLQTVGGQVQLVDNDAVADGNDGTDTLVGIETVQFKDQSMGIVSPVILDLGGSGIRTVSAARSSAIFDMDGDGIGDDTSWIGANNAFLFLDRDGNGTLSGVAEMSFTSDREGAETDLQGLAAFDSNGDGMISSADARFNDFRLWRDANGDGTVQAAEILGLGDAGVASISLAATATSSKAALGDVAVVNTSSWTRTDGEQMQVADAMLTYFSGPPGSPESPDSAGQAHRPAMLHDILPLLRQQGLVGRGANRDWDSFFERSHRVQSAPGASPIGTTAGEEPRHNQIVAKEPVPEAAETSVQRQLGAMVQDLATFGIEPNSTLDVRRWHVDRPIDLFAA